MGWVPPTEKGTLPTGPAQRITAAIEITVFNDMPMSCKNGWAECADQVRRPEGHELKFYVLLQ